MRFSSVLLVSLLTVGCAASSSSEDLASTDDALSSGNTSTYSSLEDCKTLELDEEHGFYKGECQSAFGFKVHVVEGDLRQNVILVSNGQELDLSVWSARPELSGFSYLGKKLEWRHKVGTTKPTSIIFRYFVQNAELTDTQYLVVAKVSSGAACITKVINATAHADANVRARAAADALPATCPAEPGLE